MTYNTENQHLTPPPTDFLKIRLGRFTKEYWACTLKGVRGMNRVTVVYTLIVKYGLQVQTVAEWLGCSRQTVYRCMEMSDYVVKIGHWCTIPDKIVKYINK